MNASATNKTDINSSTTAVARESEDCAVVLGTLLPFAVLIVVTNGLVCALFWRRRKLRTTSNLLLLSLAGSDLLNGALNCPFSIVYFCTYLRELALFLAPVHNFAATSCALHILAITTEKYVAITKPLRHHSVTKKTIGYIAAGIWLVSAVIAFIPLTWLTPKGQGMPSAPAITITYAGFCLVAVFLVPCACMIYGYVKMFRIINKRSGTNQQLSGRGHVYRKVQNDRKCLIVFASMATVFVVCWLPYYALMLIIEARVSSPPEEVFQCFVFMRYLSSIINPLLYTFFKKDFWKAFKQLILCRDHAVAATASFSAIRRGSGFTVSTFLKGKSAYKLQLQEGSIHSLGNALSSSDSRSEILFVSAV